MLLQCLSSGTFRELTPALDPITVQLDCQFPPSAQAHYIASIRGTIIANSDNSLLTLLILILIFRNQIN